MWTDPRRTDGTRSAGARALLVGIGGVGLVTLLAACGASDAPTTPQPGEAAVTAVSPAGGAVGVEVGAALTVTFSRAMPTTMSAYVALHEGSVTGPTVPGTVSWQRDNTQLVFTPATPMKPRTQYTFHMGAGMMGTDGRPVDYGRCAGFGGQTVPGAGMGGGMGGGNGGMASSMMGPGWRGADGTYGMTFTFTTR